MINGENLIELPIYPIFCRGHSGGRLLCEAFQRNGIQMGNVSEERKDTLFFSADQPQLQQIILNAFSYPHVNLQSKKYYQALMQQCLQTFIDTDNIDPTQPLGWKHGISLFCMPVLLDAFPTAKVIHLIRDGRDVMLSRLNARIGNLHDPLNRLVVFGDATVTHYEGEPLETTTVEKYRNELELWHWVTAVKYGLLGRNYPKQYLEIRYEQLCQQPVATCEQIFAFLNVPFKSETKAWLQQKVYTHRIAKWHDLPTEQLARVDKIAGDLLRKLGYT